MHGRGELAVDIPASVEALVLEKRAVAPLADPDVLATIRGEKRPPGGGTPVGPAPRVDRASATV